MMAHIINVYMVTALAFVLAMPAHSQEERGACPSDSVCVPLNECPKLRSVAVDLEATSQLDKKVELLNNIKKHLCGDLSDRVWVCCQLSEGSKKDETTSDTGLELSRLTFHEVGGKVEIVNADTIVIHDFVYDGEGPDVFFVVGLKGSKPGLKNAIPVPYPAFDPQVKVNVNNKEIPILGEYSGEEIELKLPEGVNAYKLKWLSLFCRDYEIDFGNVIFRNNDVPRN